MDNRFCDVLVVGGGVAGLRAAISAAGTGASTCIVCGDGGASRLAIADYTVADDDEIGTTSRLANAIWYDSFGLAVEAKVKRYVSDARQRLSEITAWGAGPVRRLGANALLVPGKSIIKALAKQARARRVETVTGALVAPIMADGRMRGVWLRRRPGDHVTGISTNAVILATGGYHSLLPASTNWNAQPPLAHALALAAGAHLTDLEMINFCPYTSRNERGLVSLIPYLANHLIRQGQAAATDDSGEWDKLSCTIELLSRGAHPMGGAEHEVSLAIPIRTVLRHLSTAARVRSVHSLFDLRLAVCVLFGCPIHVGISPHYSCGGIVTAENGSTDAPGVFACGEASSGVFGAFRTASSITDCLVFGKIAGKSAARHAAATSAVTAERIDEVQGQVQPTPTLDAIRKILGSCMLPFRTETRLREGLAELDTLARGNHDVPQSDRLLRRLAEAVLRSALVRKDSRGFHIRRDYPFIDPDYDGNTVARMRDDEVAVSFVPRTSDKKLVSTRTDFHAFAAQAPEPAALPR